LINAPTAGAWTRFKNIPVESAASCSEPFLTQSDQKKLHSGGGAVKAVIRKANNRGGVAGAVSICLNQLSGPELTAFFERQIDYETASRIMGRQCWSV
jgi:hypothetical protein